MPGSFVPTVTAITSSQDLQWMVQPTLISSQAPGQGLGGPPAMTHQGPHLGDPYDMPGPSYATGSSFPSSGVDPQASGPAPQGPAQGPAPGPMRSSRARNRNRVREESVSDDGDGGVLVSVCALPYPSLPYPTLSYRTVPYHNLPGPTNKIKIHPFIITL